MATPPKHDFFNMYDKKGYTKFWRYDCFLQKNIKPTFLESINLIAYIQKAKLALSLAFAIAILLIKGHMNMIIVVFRNTSTIWH